MMEDIFDKFIDEDEEAIIDWSESLW